MDEFINSNKLCVIFFTSSEFNELNKTMNQLQQEIGKYRFLILNIQETQNKSIVKKLKLKSVPLFHIYKNKNLIEEIFGTYKNISTIIRLHF